MSEKDDFYTALMLASQETTGLATGVISELARLVSECTEGMWKTWPYAFTDHIMQGGWVLSSKIMGAFPILELRQHPVNALVLLTVRTTLLGHVQLRLDAPPNCIWIRPVV